LKAETKDKIVEACEVFNRYRSPEAKAEVVSFYKDSFKVKFSGAFCLTCGFYDYFDDMASFLEEFGIKAKIEKVRETEDGGIVEFKLKN